MLNPRRQFSSPRYDQPRFPMGAIVTHRRVPACDDPISSIGCRWPSVRLSVTVPKDQQPASEIQNAGTAISPGIETSAFYTTTQYRHREDSPYLSR